MRAKVPLWNVIWYFNIQDRILQCNSGFDNWNIDNEGETCEVLQIHIL